MTLQKSKKESSGKKGRRESAFIAVALYVLLFVGTVIAGVYTTRINQYNYSVGDICENTITAPYDFVDEYSTNLLREEEKQKVQPIYKRDTEVEAAVTEKIESVFTEMENARIYAKQVYASSQENMVFQFLPSTVNWELVLNESDLKKMKQSMPDYITDKDLYVIAALSQDKLSSIKTTIIDKIEPMLEEGIISDDLSKDISEIVAELRLSEKTQASLIDLITRILTNSVSANLIFDTEATEAAKQAAADAVAKVEYKKGENIVRQGERITEKQFNIINQLGLSADSDTTLLRIVLGTIIVGISFGCLIMYFSVADKAHLYSPKKALSIVLLSAVTIGIAIGTKSISQWATPIFLAVIVATAFLKPRTALAYSVFMSIIIAFVVSETDDYFFSEYTVARLVAGISGSVVAVLTLQKKLHRGEYILSGLYAGIITGLVYLSYVLINNFPFKTGFIVTLIGIASGLVCGLLSVGVLPIWENMFSLDTPSKLLEIASPGNELLKNLMVYAPGTYHHSVMVANLAEAGVSAVGGNALLARVASYYHDIGKLQNPNMFSENQMNISNPHDELTPEKSAEIIIGHVKHGKLLAEKNKLPKAVKDIIIQHHGDSLVGYFYIVAKQAGEVDQSKFRYPGPKPETKEAGIVMLADTVEAAIRANNTLRNGGNIDEQIEKLIKAKYDDGQLDQCPLNRRDLYKIKEAFLSVFSRANHERIVYPEDDD